MVGTRLGPCMGRFASLTLPRSSGLSFRLPVGLGIFHRFLRRPRPLLFVRLHLSPPLRLMAPFTHHVFICGNRREPGHRRGCCDCDGQDSLRSAFKAEIARRGWKGLVRANSAGCLDQCELGPVVVIYPQGIWYGGVGEGDVGRILNAIASGEVVQDLLIPDEALNTKGAHPWRPPPRLINQPVNRPANSNIHSTGAARDADNGNSNRAPLGDNGNKEDR